MDLEKLRETISEFREQGLSNVQIARKLKRQGVKSLRGAKEPTATMVGYHIRAMQREAGAPQTTKAKPTPTTGRPMSKKIELAQRILATDLPASDKLELVENLLA